MKRRDFCKTAAALLAAGAQTMEMRDMGSTLFFMALERKISLAPYLCEDVIRVMDEGIAEANRKVLEKSFENEELAGMGTTMVVAFAEDGQLYVANVGDSRLYLIGHEINQVTEDHSYVAAMMRAGELTEEQARNHPEKNVITRAIGVAWEVKADFFEVDLKPGDKVMMCSDGLSNMIEDQRLYDVISSNSVEDSVRILIDEAKENGGYDNITVIVIEPRIEEVNEC